MTIKEKIYAIQAESERNKLRVIKWKKEMMDDDAGRNAAECKKVPCAI